MPLLTRKSKTAPHTVTVTTPYTVDPDFKKTFRN